MNSFLSTKKKLSNGSRVLSDFLARLTFEENGADVGVLFSCFVLDFLVAASLLELFVRLLTDEVVLLPCCDELTRFLASTRCEAEFSLCFLRSRLTSSCLR